MTAANTTFTRAFVAGLEAAGVTHACVSPGSRNTPLSIAIADSAIEDSSHHDERSASFFAIGLAKQTGRPVAVVTTSGTAAAELHAAIAEADASAVPMIALTADRPSELIGTAAPQTIDQRNLFGGMVRWSFDLDIDDSTDAASAAELGVRAVREALEGAPGPVHCNLRFREPLVIAGEPGSVDSPIVSRRSIHPTNADVDAAAAALSTPHGVVVVGPHTWREGAESIAAFGRARGWPVMADPLSGLRTGLKNTDGVVGSDLLAAAGWLDRAQPEAVLRIGRPPTSKSLNTWLGDHPDVPQVVVAPWGRPDPMGSAALMVRADAGPMAEALSERSVQRDPTWVGKWVTAQSTAIEASALSIAGLPFPSEPAIASILGSSLSNGATLWAGSSMPIRDIDSFLPVTARPIALHGHRGANGIDGLISAALGSTSSGAPTVALTGDVAMVHDIGALASMARHNLPLTVVVVNNDGGGIFHFLDQHGHPHFERHFGTPHGFEFDRIGQSFGIDSTVASTARDFERALARVGQLPQLIEVRTDRDENLVAHRTVAAAVREAVEGLL